MREEMVSLASAWKAIGPLAVPCVAAVRVSQGESLVAVQPQPFGV